MDEHGGTINHWIRFYSSMLERGLIQENGVAHDRLKYFKRLKEIRRRTGRQKLKKYKNLIKAIEDAKKTKK